MIGEPIPYQLKTDDVVTALWLCCLLLLALSAVALGKPLGRKIKQLPLFNFRQSDWMPAETPGGVRPFLLLQTLLILSLLLLDISARLHLQEVASFFTPVLLLVYMLLAILTISFHWLLYKFVLWLFVYPVQIPLVMEAWVNYVCFEGMLFFPFVVVDIYYDLPFVLFAVCLVFITLLPRLWLFYWLKKLFCLKLYGSLLIFLYFCALESVPLWLFALGTGQLNRYLLF